MSKTENNKPRRNPSGRVHGAASLECQQARSALHVPAPTIYAIVHEERGISPEMALRLARFFRNIPDF